MNSLVDRSIHPILEPKPSNTPSSSRRNKISSHIERLHRLHGTSILYHASILLRTSPSTYATSTVIFHRFYHSASLQDYNVWSTSMACTLLACKLQEDVRRIREIILVYVHLYRRFKLQVGYSDCNQDSTSNGEAHTRDDSLQTAKSIHLPLTCEQKQNMLRYIHPLLPNGPIYKEFESVLTNMENIILRKLGFSLYWIGDSHPHVFLLYFLKVLEIEDDGSCDDSNNSHSAGVAQSAWKYCNDSCHLDFCVRYEPEITACAAIYLACYQNNILLPLKPRPWWEVFIGTNHEQDLSNICNALLALGDEGCIEGYSEALRTYVISLEENGSFNDPGSYIWKTLD